MNNENEQAEKFKEFVKKLVAIPKRKIDEQIKLDKEKRDKKKLSKQVG